MRVWILFLFFSFQALFSYEPFSPFWMGSYVSASGGDNSVYGYRGLELGYWTDWSGHGVNLGLGGRQIYSSKGNRNELSLSLFYNYRFLGTWFRYGQIDSGLGVFFYVHPEKRIFLERKWNPYFGFTKDSIGFISGKTFLLNFQVSRLFFQSRDEWEISFGIGLKYSNYYAHSLANFSEFNKERFMGGVAYLSEKENHGIIKEQYVFEEVKKFPKRPLRKKYLNFRKVFARSPVVYPLNLNELIGKGIPLREAILIQKASENPSEYYRVLKTFPKDTIAKCYSLQKEKSEKEGLE